MNDRIPITVARGDGIGPEIMDATLELLERAGAGLDIEAVAVGAAVYQAGNRTGIEPELWSSLARTGVLFKAPVTTPQGGGFKSVNVTVRKTLGLFANVRPVQSLHPFLRTHHPTMDVVVVRENEEDVYGGIEHRQTDEVVQCLKLITRPGCLRICRYAFEYARLHGRRKVTCFTKDNIMKLTDGLFHAVFDEVARDYPDIRAEHMIVDIGTARLAAAPEAFDVIVVPNLYGDIVSDVAAEIVGSVGLAGSANVGERAAMFEAVHGSAPDIAGKGIANPSGLITAAVMMLSHVGRGAVAQLVHDAWLRTIEDGLHTADVFHQSCSKHRVGTKEFADAVAERLGEQPRRLAAQRCDGARVVIPPTSHRKAAERRLVGVDIFVRWDADDRRPARLADLLLGVERPQLSLSMITNRGQVVWPEGFTETFCTDHWRCRFEAPSGPPLRLRDIVDLLDALDQAGVDVIKTENLYTFDGVPGYSMGQGQCA